MKEWSYQEWSPDLCLERLFEWIEGRCKQMGIAKGVNGDGIW